MSENKKRGFIKNAAILSLAGIICKILGAVYRIPLAGVLGTEGMGCYQLAFPVYSFLVTVTCSGIPIAVSGLTAKSIASGDDSSAYAVFCASKKILAFLGVICSLLMLVFSDLLAEAMNLKSAAFSMRCLAPSLFFLSLCSAYRGYMQGRMEMGSTAVSQLSEQIVRMTVGLILAVFLSSLGKAYGAGGAAIGVTLAEACGLIVMIIDLKIKKCRPVSYKKNTSENIKKILKIALPVTIGACGIAAVSVIDSSMIMKILKEIGFSQKNASSAYGLLSGYVQPLINMPAVLSGAAAVSIVPAVAAACARKDSTSLGTHSALAFRLSSLVSIPCSIAVFILAEPLLRLMYSSLKGEELLRAVSLTRLLCPSIIFISIGQVCSAVLQGCGRTVLPVFSTALGALLKVFIGLWLIRIPQVNIAGAAIGTIICFGASSMVNIALCQKYALLHVDVKGSILLPLVASMAMALCIFIINGYMSNTVGTVLSILAGIVVYAIILSALGGIKPEDMRFIPGGDKIKSLLIKMRIWR